MSVMTGSSAPGRPDVPYGRRRLIAGLGVGLLIAAPLLVFLEEVGGLGIYFTERTPPGQAAYIMMRAAGHIAFVLLFLQVALGQNVRSVAKWLGIQGLVRIHMAIGLTALTFALLHPVLFLWARTLRSGAFEPIKVFAPLPTDYYHTMLTIGAVGFYLLVVAIAAGWFGPRLAPRFWRRVHMLNYGVFFLVWFHANAIGSETRHPVLLGLYGLMLATVVILAIRGIWRRVKGR